MISIVDKIKKSDVVFSLLLFGFGILPYVLKIILTGAVGPTFDFYFIVFWLPIIAICMAVVRGWGSAGITTALILISFSIAILTYPSDPPMDFRRQFVYQIEPWIILAFLISWMFQIIGPKLKIKASQ
jgi:hypothetical protein